MLIILYCTRGLRVGSAGNASNSSLCSIWFTIWIDGLDSGLGWQHSQPKWTTYLTNLISSQTELASSGTGFHLSTFEPYGATPVSQIIGAPLFKDWFLKTNFEHQSVYVGIISTDHFLCRRGLHDITGVLWDTGVPP